MIDLNKILSVISDNENTREYTIQENLESDSFTLRLSKRLTYLLLRRNGKFIGQSNSMANNPFRYYSEIDLPKLFVKRLILDGGISDIELTTRKIGFLNYIRTDDIDVDSIRFFKDREFKYKRNLEFKENGVTYFINIYKKEK